MMAVANDKFSLNASTVQGGQSSQVKKIDIHIGMEKTGTSSIQAALTQAKNDLREVGILFPESLKIPNQTYLATAFQADDKIDDLRIRNNVLGKESLARFRERLLRDFEGELGRSDYQRIVISSEHLSSRLASVEEIERLKTFFNRFGSEVSIYLYLRPQDEFYISHYSTAVKIGDTSNDFAFPPLTDAREDMFYDRLVMRWVSVFGREHVHIRLYGRSGLADGDVVVDFWRWLGLPEDLRPEIKEYNLSLDVKKLEFMRFFNMHVPRFVNDRLNRMRGRIVAAMEKLEPMGKNMVVSETERAEFLALFAEGNRKVAVEFFGRECLFAPKTVKINGPEKAPEEERLTAGDAVKIAAALWQMQQEEIIRKESRIADLKAGNQRYKEQNNELTNGLDEIARYSFFRHPLKKWHAYKTLMKNYRHGKAGQ